MIIDERTNYRLLAIKVKICANCKNSWVDYDGISICEHYYEIEDNVKYFRGVDLLGTCDKWEKINDED